MLLAICNRHVVAVACLSAVGAVILAPSIARAEMSGDDVLARMDSAHLAAKDQVATVEMTVADATGEARHLGMQLHTRGKQRRVAFLYPGDVKGIRVLTLSKEQMYVYLPAFRKVRRIASHVREQSMFGMDYTYDDMSTVTFRDSYNAKILRENDTAWVLDLTPKNPATAPYARLEVTISRANNLPSEIAYYSSDGKKARTETRWDYRCQNAVCVAYKTKMVDHSKGDHVTEVTIKDTQLNTGLADGVFSLRDLQRE